MKSLKKKTDIILGNVTVSGDELDLSDAKVRITMMVDLATLRDYKAIAKKTGTKYQTLMNHRLKEALKNEQPSHSDRLERLEKAVFKMARS